MFLSCLAACALEIVKEFRSFCMVQEVYGPDITTQQVRELTPDDIEFEALNNWLTDGTQLLPRRYRLLLESLYAEGVISKTTFIHHHSEAMAIVFGSQHHPLSDTPHHLDERVEPCWIDDPSVANHASLQLQNKIRCYAQDLELFRRSVKGAVLILRSYDLV